MGQHDDERDHLIEQVFETQHAMMRSSLAAELEPLLDSTLTMQQFKLLAIVHFHGEQTVSGLAEAMRVSMPTVSGAVERLVERDLLSRREDPDDRRVRLIGLAEAGKRLFAEAEATRTRLGRDLLGELDLDALRALAGAYTQLADAVERRLGPSR
ncbi:MarR family transcriptional regulator [Occultella glacieicola]|uniref:MarR family transcriptional regulator n=1 Tax=Occultella glacieicola TaxID=2518684 RepID=A0ABY2E719_9MICO|nr:MarR family transcriptional regulator [Occultella glacieicola]TDE97218.1 MarR family transcriptional regulator [Occultella glacieicola]